jgi:hypothetical protein
MLGTSIMIRRWDSALVVPAGPNGRRFVKWARPTSRGIEVGHLAENC